MEPSRYDIPALSAGVKGIEEQQLPDVIALYRGELSEALRKSDRVKMVRAGQVLVSLLAKQNEIFLSRPRRAFYPLD